jgi:hypothetical protein
MTQPATRHFLWVSAWVAVAAVATFTAVLQWRISQRVARLEGQLALHESWHESERVREKQKAAWQVELRSRAYFSPGAFAQDPERDRTLAESFSAPLRSLRLAPLWKPTLKPPSAIWYRLTWLAEPDRPVAVAINYGGPQLTRAKSYVRETGVEEPVGDALPMIDQAVGPERVAEFDRLLAAADLWKMPTITEDEAGGARPRSVFECTDGQGRYHVVVRATPGPSSYRDVCQFMLRWIGLRRFEERPAKR